MALMMREPIIRCVTDTSVSTGELGVPDETPDMPIEECRIAHALPNLVLI